MSVAHDSITAAQLKIRQTKDTVLSNFYWPGLGGDVTKYCRSCDVSVNGEEKYCDESVPGKGFPDTLSSVLRLIVWDLSTRQVRQRGEHRFILMLVDNATRYAEAVLAA
ncbi:Zinc finger protein [Plakobranchus ocellatus]|uniref:Zinc finger protein n=1 Tax=Plakobranchus ocellatus TaxID=259542 RepID=A0AAV4B2T3_9GAST|nr:Zinc finger protein [Plakobranchus ocellatus]